MAFVSSVTSSSFTGSAVNGQWNACMNSLKQGDSVSSTTTTTCSPRMSFYNPSDGLLSKYDKIAKEPGAVLPSSQPSSVWKKYISYTLNTDVLPSYAPQGLSWADNFQVYMYSISRSARTFFAPGGKPKVTRADEYMAGCVAQQYKRMACSTGVYEVTCTEGAVSQQADQARVLALGTAFRSEQKSTSAHFGMMYENRKRAIMLSHGCSYEESLYSKLPKTSGIAVRAAAEAGGSCSRAALSDDVAEKYMMASVDRQCKQMSVSTGVYSVACGDGHVKGLSEEKRVLGLAAKFRAGQLPLGAKLARDFDRRKMGRDMYAHGCSYEEDLFNKYPSMAASMSNMASSY